MAAEVTVEASFDGGKPMEVLSQLVERRVQYLKGETTESATRATMINVVGSLRASTKSMKKTVNKAAYKLELIGVSRFTGERGRSGRHHLPYTFGGERIHGMWPVNWMYGKYNDGQLWRITMTNPNIRPRAEQKRKNPPYYIVACPSQEQADQYAKLRLAVVRKHEGGLAKLTLGYAQAKVSDRPMKGGGKGHAASVAENSVNVQSSGNGYSSGTFAMAFHDTLRYAELAQRGGAQNVSNAMMKAANKTAAIINRMGTAKLTDKIPTPFPEVAKSKGSN